ncbi:uncharacterized protein LOC143480792 [Brachyhypopomus gauderio]|uniref:uncharacterized protein LOC143480792 n=1 Tax=Brachyhypopomus gauderio TaxID=698409 RepID=UPI004042D740
MVEKSFEMDSPHPKVALVDTESSITSATVPVSALEVGDRRGRWEGRKRQVLQQQEERKRGWISENCNANVDPSTPARSLSSDFIDKQDRPVIRRHLCTIEGCIFTPVWSSEWVVVSGQLPLQVSILF